MCNARRIYDSMGMLITCSVISKKKKKKINRSNNFQGVLLSLITPRALDNLALNFMLSILCFSSRFKNFLLVEIHDLFTVFNLSFLTFKSCHCLTHVNNSLLKFCTSSFNTMEFNSDLFNFSFNCLICYFNFIVFMVLLSIYFDEESLFTADPIFIFVYFCRTGD